MTMKVKISIILIPNSLEKPEENMLIDVPELFGAMY